MRLFTSVVILCSLSLVLLWDTAGAASDVRSATPGTSGEIPYWLALGYFPIPAATGLWQATLETDLLTAAGGETAVEPVGGRSVAVDAAAGTEAAGTTLTWRLVRPAPPPVLSRAGYAATLRLFDDQQGRPLPNTGVYLHCRLVTPAPRNVRLLLGSDDSVKVRLNGQVVFQFVGQRSCGQDHDEVPLALGAGTNSLLVRVDNYVGNGGCCARLVDAAGAPFRDVEVMVTAGAATAELEQPAARGRPWAEVTAAIPPVPATEHETLFGARLARTMALLESGGRTHRPVRIFFYGQSITAQEWTTLLIQRLRERYPETTIEAYNLALGGWGVDRLCRTLKHDILRARPDLVCFHAYGGTEETWERVIQDLRRETCADILLKTAHLAAHGGTNYAAQPPDDPESLTIRRVAQAYGCELVEVRREWRQYLDTHGWGVTNLLCDSVHLNRAGNVLMAQLYERHFRVNTLMGEGWADRVRFYQALRALADRQTNEIALSGSGWKATPYGVESTSPADALRLRVIGNRVDLVLLPGTGGARVLLDGRPPSAWRLQHGTLPLPGLREAPPRWLMRYFEAPDVVQEKWTLTFTHASRDWRRFRYRLSGTVTGLDGEGDSEHEFVSTSGRIRILPEDFTMPWPIPQPDPNPEPVPLDRPLTLNWQIVADGQDEVRGLPANVPPDRARCTYVTVADGLPFGQHELTVVPVGDGPIGIRGVEVYRPPLAEMR